MTAKQLVEEFRKMLGWPYKWGDAKRGSVDCSGAFVYAFRLHGLSIYHGSNTIWRSYLSAKGKIEEVPLAPGVAVFKWREDGEPDKYKNDGEDDFYHIGLYVGGGKVIEAKSVKYGCVESDLSSGWTHAGYLKDIDYTEEEGEEEMPMQEGMRTAVVVAESGNTVNVRREPNGERVGTIALGETVKVYSSEGGWSSVAHEQIAGYMKTEFLRFEEEPAGEDIVSVQIDLPREWAVYLSEKFKEAAEALG